MQAMTLDDIKPAVQVLAKSYWLQGDQLVQLGVITHHHLPSTQVQVIAQVTHALHE
jgi:hypothetical protein